MRSSRRARAPMSSPRSSARRTRRSRSSSTALREAQAALAEKNGTTPSSCALRAEEARASPNGRRARRARCATRWSSRDATIAQVLHSLGERDAQLCALQREHAQIVPDLEARSIAGAQLEARAAARRRAQAEALHARFESQPAIGVRAHGAARARGLRAQRESPRTGRRPLAGGVLSRGACARVTGAAGFNHESVPRVGRQDRGGAERARSAAGGVRSL